MVVAFPPPVLDILDDVNVTLSALSLAILGLLFVVAIGGSLYLLLETNWKHWSTTVRVVNGTKIFLFLAASVLLAVYTIQMLIYASEIVLQRERSVPSNTIMGIEVCDDRTFAER